MKTSGRLSDKEYEELSLEYAQNTLELSGNPGFLKVVSKFNTKWYGQNDSGRN